MTVDDLAASFGHEDADEEGESDKFIVQLNNAYLDWYDQDEGTGGHLVVLGTEAGASDWEAGISINVILDEDLDIDSHTTIQTTGGAPGIAVNVSPDDNFYGRVRVRNYGSVETTGGGSDDAGRRGYAIVSSSQTGDAEVINEQGGTVTGKGPGGRGQGNRI